MFYLYILMVSFKITTSLEEPKYKSKRILPLSHLIVRKEFEQKKNLFSWDKAVNKYVNEKFHKF